MYHAWVWKRPCARSLCLWSDYTSSISCPLMIAKALYIESLIIKGYVMMYLGCRMSNRLAHHEMEEYIRCELLWFTRKSLVLAWHVGNVANLYWIIESERECETHQTHTTLNTYCEYDGTVYCGKDMSWFCFSICWKLSFYHSAFLGISFSIQTIVDVSFSAIILML